MEEMKVLCITDNYEELLRIAAEGKKSNKYVLLRLGSTEEEEKVQEELSLQEDVIPIREKGKWEIPCLLKKLGIPSHLKGYRFLGEALEITLKDPLAVDAITKCVYPEVAKKFSTTSSRVERAVRHAIEVAWTKRGEIPFQEKVFGCTLDLNKKKPTNSQFIATLADYILMHRSDR